jgi:hypothetical protein
VPDARVQALGLQELNCACARVQALGLQELNCA